MARLTITEAATRLHVSPDSIRRRLRKGQLMGARDNRGQWWLDLPDDMQMEAPSPSVETRLAPAMLAPAQQQPMQLDPALVDALRGQVADLTWERQRADQAEARANRAEAQEAAARARFDQIERERDTALQERDTTRQDREDARVRAALAEGEARALREALEQAQRPAWRRWLGLPDRQVK